MARLRAPVILVLASGCAVRSQPPAPAPVRVVEPARPDPGQRLAELPLLHVYERADVYRPGLPDWYAEYAPPIGDGVLVRGRAGMPPLSAGDRLAVVQDGSDISYVVVTDQGCPPAAPDCLACGTHWGERIEGPAIDPDAIVAIVGPLGEDVFELEPRVADDWTRASGLLVTHDGVRLRETFECSGKMLFDRECVFVTEFMLGDAIRELSRWSTRSSVAVPQLFGVLAWPGRGIMTYQGEDTVGGPGQVVLSEWNAAPEVPVKDATYWLVSSTDVVGSVRFDPPYSGGYCSFMSNPCWGTTAVQLPPPGAAVELVIGPIPEPAPPMLADVQFDDAGGLAARIGAPEQPWAVIEARQFDCREEEPRWSSTGICFETLTTTADVQQRRMSFFPMDVHHPRARTFCVEQSAAPKFRAAVPQPPGAHLRARAATITSAAALFSK